MPINETNATEGGENPMTEEERIFKGGLYASEEPELVEKKGS